MIIVGKPRQAKSALKRLCFRKVYSERASTRHISNTAVGQPASVPGMLSPYPHFSFLFCRFSLF